MIGNKGQGTGWIVAGIIILLLVFGGCALVKPKYKVYTQEHEGIAQLREAEWNRQIAVEEAKAMKESAVLKKEADIIRAEGVAEANMIIAESLTDEYLRFKWIEGLQDGRSEVIYVPTEANLPLLEARDER